MLSNIINLILLTGFILSILNIIKMIFQYIPIISNGLSYKPSDKEIFLFGLSISYIGAYIIKGLGI